MDNSLLSVKMFGVLPNHKHVETVQKLRQIATEMALSCLVVDISIPDKPCWKCGGAINPNEPFQVWPAMGMGDSDSFEHASDTGRGCQRKKS